MSLFIFPVLQVQQYAKTVLAYQSFLFIFTPAIWHSLMGSVGVVIFGCFDGLSVMCGTTNEHNRCSTNKPKTSDAFEHAQLNTFFSPETVCHAKRIQNFRP